MKINKAGNRFNEYHMEKQNGLAKKKKNQSFPFERMATVSLSFISEGYKHIVKNTDVK